MRKGAAALRADGADGSSTAKSRSSPPARPACRAWRATTTTPARDADYIVVEMAKHLLGPDWLADYVAKANRGGIERVLL